MENNETKIPEYFIRTDSSKFGQVKTDYPEALFIHLHDENKDDLYVGDCKVTDRFNVGNIEDNVKTISVGGLEASTIGELKGKSMSQIVLDMVCPHVNPTVKEYNSITVSYSGSRLIKVGTPLPNESDISVTVKRGSWNDSDIDIYRTVYAGDYTIEKTITGGDWGVVANEGTCTINVKVTFEDGVAPKDNYGTLCNDLKYIGGVKTSSISINAVHPIYINDGVDIKDMKEHLIDYITGAIITVTIPDEIDGTNDKFKISLHSGFEKFLVYQENPTKENVYDIPINMELIKIEGTTLHYIRTTDVNSTKGSAKYKIEFKK